MKTIDHLETLDIRNSGIGFKDKLVLESKLIENIENNKVVAKKREF